jgi:hypothetical protein
VDEHQHYAGATLTVFVVLEGETYEGPQTTSIHRSLRGAVSYAKTAQAFHFSKWVEVPVREPHEYMVGIEIRRWEAGSVEMTINRVKVKK